MALGRMKVYSLTNLTRTSSSQRRVVIHGLDLPARGLVIALIGLLPGLLVSAIAYKIFGTYGFIMLPATEGGLFWLVESRTRGGLHLRQYQSLVDRRRSNVGKFTCCGVVVDPLSGKWGTLVSSSTENLLPASHPKDDYSDVLLVRNG